MSLAIHFLIIQKDTVLGSGTHEVIVARAGCEAATHSGSRLLAEFTSLTIRRAESPGQTLRCLKPLPSPYTTTRFWVSYHSFCLLAINRITEKSQELQSPLRTPSLPMSVGPYSYHIQILQQDLLLGPKP